jgi:CubicO group peptidase (beta-lactamase class C family)
VGTGDGQAGELITELITGACAAELAATAEATSFSGVVSISRGGDRWTMARGAADRGHGVPIDVATRFGLASGCKTFTALVVVGLVIDGVLALDTTARTLLGADLPAIDDAVTVEHLLTHRSGIGDYLDEEELGEITDHVMPIAVHLLAGTEDYVGILDGHPQVTPPGEAFAYNNGGFVVLAVLAERAAGVPFHELVQRRVFDAAGMTGAAYLRNDELPGDVAIGYLYADGLRTNALHLPVRGSGDGGAQAGVDDIDRFWTAFAAGRIVPEHWVAAMTTPRSTTASGRSHYGMGVWIDATTGWWEIEGYDAGVSFRSVHDPAAGRTRTVVSNWSDGAWPLCAVLDRHGA